MKNPIRVSLDWYHRQNIRIQIVVAIIGAFGLVLAAGVGGCFDLLSAFVQSGTRRGGNLPVASVVQKGSGNFQVGRDLSVTGDLNVQGGVGQVIVIAPQLKDSSKAKSRVPIETFIPASVQVQERVRAELEAIRKTSGPLSIVLSVEMGSLNRRKVADEMAKIFETAGFSVQILASRALSQEQAPIKATCNADAQSRAVDILRSLGPMLKGNIALRVVKNRNPPDELFIKLLGNPSFFPDGSVIFEEPQ